MSGSPVRVVDVLVVGAGPIGLATAIAVKMADARMEVHVIERGDAPLDKACGEGIMPAGVEALRTLGVDVTQHAGTPFYGIRYTDGAHSARGGFVGAAGWAMRRTALTAVLRQRASALGIDVVDACTWQQMHQDAAGVVLHTTQGSWRARTLVGADGLHSALRKQVGLAQAKPQASLRRFGARKHYACAPWSQDVEVYWTDGAEAYVTPVGADAVGVAILWGPKPARFEALLERFVPLAQKLYGHAVISDVRGAGALSQPVARRYAGRVALVGDAAGYLDALTGEGLTTGFLSALALGRVLAANEPLAVYEAAYRRLSRAYYREARWLLALARRPWLRRLALRLLARAPWVMQGFIAAHAARRMIRPSDFWSRAIGPLPARCGEASPDSMKKAG